MQVRRHPHILPLKEIDDAAVRPVQIPQVTGKGRGGGTGGGILIHATIGKGVAGMKQLLIMYFQL